MTDAVELVPFDEDAYYQDPLGFFARLRESRPVAPVRLPGYGRAWIITRYADVRTALTDSRLAKDVHRWPGGGRSRPSEATGVYAHMLHADPPGHTRLRRLVQKAFTPRRIAQRRPRTQEIAAGLLEEMAARGDVIDLLGRWPGTTATIRSRPASPPAGDQPGAAGMVVRRAPAASAAARPQSCRRAQLRCDAAVRARRRHSRAGHLRAGAR